jgi:DNA-binding cell septation regulator SpoVG
LGKFREFDSPSGLKAVAGVIFDEAIEIECKIFDGENGLWVSWPSQQNARTGRWKKLVDIMNYKLRESVERALIDRYKLLRAEND